MNLLSHDESGGHAPGMVTLSVEEIASAIHAALAEDVGPGDATTLATVPEEAAATARMRARQPLTVAGIAFARATFQSLSPRIQITSLAKDSDLLQSGEVLLEIRGPARAILTGERVALNFVQRLSGVATLTARFVEAVRGTRAQILDTRKTTPGWRRFESMRSRVEAGRIIAPACSTWC